MKYLSSSDEGRRGKNYLRSKVWNESEQCSLNQAQKKICLQEAFFRKLKKFKIYFKGALYTKTAIFSPLNTSLKNKLDGLKSKFEQKPR